MERVTERFDQSLDVRNFVRVHTNLHLLLKVLFSDQQLLLFKHQRHRSVKSSSSSMSQSTEDNIGKDHTSLIRANAFKKLVGFQANSKLDRLLMEGIFGADPSEKTRNMGRIERSMQSFRQDTTEMTNYDNSRTQFASNLRLDLSHRSDNIARRNQNSLRRTADHPPRQAKLSKESARRRD